ncbi:putative mitochondrial protein [Tanacetum coccineum]
MAFLSKTLAPKHQSLSAYEKELLAMVVALQKWRGYLLNRHFKIRTDHFSLKYVLDQRITILFQSKWFPKLLGFDYEFEYKQGKDNVVADALSRIQREGKLLTILTALPSNEFMEAISAMWTTDPVLSGIVKDLQDSSLVTSKYTWQNDQLKRKGRWVVRHDEYATNNTPFKVVYSQPPPLHIPYMSKDSKVELVDMTLTVMEKTIDMLKFNLAKAQNRMKVQADKHRTEIEFSVGD